MARHVLNTLVLLTALTSANAYWLMGIENFITTERLDPIVNPGKISGHVHSVLGGSNFRMNTNTASLRNSECTSIPIPQDKSNYWFPHLYFQWGNGSFTSLSGGAVIYYLFSDKAGTTTAFPDDFRMLSGTPTLRTYDPNSYAQQAITFLCLDFNGVTTRHNSLPTKACPSGVRAQVNFPSCWDGKNLDSPDHKSHVAFLSGGPDSGTCSDPKYPVTLPRIFIEVYWNTADVEQFRSQAMNPSQPLVYAYGDPTGYGYHADFINGWDKGVLQNAVDNCNCNEYGDPTCCVQKGIFDMTQGKQCHITKSIDEQTTGTLAKLPGNNPVQPGGKTATSFTDSNTPVLLSPVYAYTGDSPTQIGKPVPPASGPAASSVVPSVSSVVSVPPSSSAPSPPSSSSVVPKPSSSAGGSSSPGAPTHPTSTPVTSAVVTPSSPAVPKPSSATGGSSSPNVPTPPVPTPVSSAVVIPSSPAVPKPSSAASGSSSPNVPTPPVSTPVSSAVITPSDPVDVPASSVPSSPATSVDGSASVPTSTCIDQPGSPATHAPPNASSTRTPPSPHSSKPLSSTHEASPTPGVPLPPSSGSGSNSPAPNAPQVPSLPSSPSGPEAGPGSYPSPDSPVQPVPGHADQNVPSPVNEPSPVTTLGLPEASPQPQSPAPGGISPSSPGAPPMCSGRKFRHKLLKEKRALEQKRSVRYARAFHENGRRFMKPHAHAGVF